MLDAPVSYRKAFMREVLGVENLRFTFEAPSVT
jgi:hypothetical protein